MLFVGIGRRKSQFNRILLVKILHRSDHTVIQWKSFWMPFRDSSLFCVLGEIIFFLNNEICYINLTGYPCVFRNINGGLSARLVLINKIGLSRNAKCCRARSLLVIKERRPSDECDYRNSPSVCGKNVHDGILAWKSHCDLNDNQAAATVAIYWRLLRRRIVV